jgi:hypothetical protein
MPVESEMRVSGISNFEVMFEVVCAQMGDSEKKERQILQSGRVDIDSISSQYANPDDQSA